MSILILAPVGDLHAEAVGKLLTDRGEQCIFYDIHQYPDNGCLGVYVGKDHQQAGLWTKTGGYNLSEVTAIYDRSDAFTPPIQEVKKGLQAYIQSEAQTFLLGLYSVLPHAFWFSNPYQVRLADIKLYQLQVAKALGFLIPETVIGNAPEVARALINEHDQQAQFVLKPLRRKLIEYEPTLAQKIQKLIYEKSNSKKLKQYKDNNIWLWEELRYRITQEVPVQSFLASEAESYLAHLPTCPVTIQTYVSKKLELRITIVGEEIFPCAIYSQEATSAQGKVDWRGHEDELRHEPYPLPGVIRERCLALMRHLGLNFGAIDMIVTPEDDYFFLEINTNGQWLWIQDMVGFPIAEAIAHCLILGKQEKQGKQEKDGILAPPLCAV